MMDDAALKNHQKYSVHSKFDIPLVFLLMWFDEKISISDGSYAFQNLLETLK